MFEKRPAGGNPGAAKDVNQAADAEKRPALDLVMPRRPASVTTRRFELQKLACAQGSGAAYFSPDYRSARQRFLAAAHGAGAHTEQNQIAAKGPNGEPLFIDVARIGRADAPKVLLVLSATHGVEGFAGSALQSAFCGLKPQVPDSCAVYLIHGLNPFGMAHLRRCNEDNIDLNRNFVTDAALWNVRNPEYARLDTLLNPRSRPSWLDPFLLKLGLTAARHGFSPLKQAIAQGQYEFPRGLFYGGTAPAESSAFLRNFLEQRKTHTARLFAVEVHTGLGPFSQSSLLSALDRADPKINFIRSACPELRMETEGGADGKHVAYRTHGGISQAVPKLLPEAEVLWLIQEAGTYNALTMLRALRHENRAHHHGSAAQSRAAKEALRAAFVPDNQRWRDRVVRDGINLIKAGAKFSFEQQ